MLKKGGGQGAMEKKKTVVPKRVEQQQVGGQERVVPTQTSTPETAQTNIGIRVEITPTPKPVANQANHSTRAHRRVQEPRTIEEIQTPLDQGGAGGVLKIPAALFQKFKRDGTPVQDENVEVDKISQFLAEAIALIKQNQEFLNNSTATTRDGTVQSIRTQSAVAFGNKLFVMTNIRFQYPKIAKDKEGCHICSQAEELQGKDTINFQVLDAALLTLQKFSLNKDEVRSFNTLIRNTLKKIGIKLDDQQTQSTAPIQDDDARLIAEQSRIMEQLQRIQNAISQQTDVTLGTTEQMQGDNEVVNTESPPRSPTTPLTSNAHTQTTSNPTELEKLERLAAEHREQLILIQRHHSDIEAAKVQIEAERNNNERLLQEIANRQASLDNQRQNYEQDFQALTARIQEANDRLTELNKETNAKAGESQQKDSQIAQQKEELEKLQLQLGEAQQRLNQLSLQNQEESNKATELKQQNTEQTATKEKLAEQITDLHKSIKDKQREIRESERKAAEDVEKTTKTIAALQEQLTALQQELSVVPITDFSKYDGPKTGVSGWVTKTKEATPQDVFNHLTSKIEPLQFQIAALTKQLPEADVNKVKEVADAMLQQVTEAKETIQKFKQLEQEHSKLQQEHAQLNADKAKIQQSLDSITQQKTNLEQEVKNQAERITQMTEAHTKVIQKKEEELRQSASKIQELEKRLQNVGENQDAELTTGKEEQERLNTELTALKTTQQEMQAFLNKTLNLIPDFETRERDILAESEASERALLEQKLKTTAPTISATGIEASTNTELAATNTVSQTITLTEQQVSDAYKQYHLGMKYLEDLLQKVEWLQDHVYAKDQTIESLNNNIQRYRAELEKAKRSISTLESGLLAGRQDEELLTLAHNLSQAGNAFNEELEEANRTIGKLTAALQQMQQQLAERESQLAAQNKETKDTATETELTREGVNALQKLEPENQNLKKELEEVRTQQQRKEQEVSDLQKQLEQLKSQQKAKDEKFLQQQQTLTKELKELQQQATTSGTENENLRGQIEEKQQRLIEQQQELEKLNKQLSSEQHQVSVKLTTAQIELETTKGQVKELQQQLNEAKLSAMRHSATLGALQESETQVATLQGQLQKTQEKQLTDLDARATTAREGTKNLEDTEWKNILARLENEKLAQSNKEMERKLYEQDESTERYKIQQEWSNIQQQSLQEQLQLKEAEINALQQKIQEIQNAWIAQEDPARQTISEGEKDEFATLAAQQKAEQALITTNTKLQERSIQDVQAYEERGRKSIRDARNEEFALIQKQKQLAKANQELLESHKEQLENLRNTHEQLQQQLTAKETELQQITTAQEELNKRLETAESEKEKNARNVSELEEKLRESQSKVSELQEQSQEATTAFEAHKNKLEAHQTELTDEIERLKEQIQEQESSKTSSQEMSTQTEADDELQKQLEEKEKDLNKLQNELKKANEEHNNEQQELQETQQRLTSELANVNEQLNQATSKQETSAADVQRLQKELQGSKESVERAQMETEDLRSQLNQQQSNMEELQQQLQQQEDAHNQAIEKLHTEQADQQQGLQQTHEKALEEQEMVHQKAMDQVTITHQTELNDLENQLKQRKSEYETLKVLLAQQQLGSQEELTRKDIELKHQQEFMGILDQSRKGVEMMNKSAVQQLNAAALKQVVQEEHIRRGEMKLEEAVSWHDIENQMTKSLQEIHGKETEALRTQNQTLSEELASSQQQNLTHLATQETDGRDSLIKAEAATRASTFAATQALLKTNQTLQRNIGELEKQKKSLESRLAEEIPQITKNSDELRTQLEQLEIQLREKETALQDALKRLEEQYNDFSNIAKQEFDKTQEELDRLRLERLEAENRVSIHTEMSTDLLGSLKQNQAQLTQFQQQFEENNRKLEDGKNSEAELQQELEKRTHDKEELQTQLERVQQENKRLAESAEELRQHCQLEIDGITQTWSALQLAQLELQDEKARLSRLNEELAGRIVILEAQLKNQSEIATREAKALQDKNTDLQSKLEEAKTKHGTDEKAKEELLGQIKTNEEAIRTHQDTANQLTQEMEELRATHAAEKVKMQSTHQQALFNTQRDYLFSSETFSRQGLQNQEAEARERLQETFALIKDIQGTHAAALQNKEKELGTLREQQETTQNELNAAQQKLDSQQTAYQDIKRKLDAEKANSLQQQEQIERKKIELEQSNERLKAQNKLDETLKKELASAQGKATDALTKLANVEALAIPNQEELEKLRGEQEQAKRDVKTLQEQLKEAERQKSINMERIAELEQNLTRLQQQSEKTEAMIQNLQHTAEQRAKELTDAISTISGLEFKHTQNINKLHLDNALLAAENLELQGKLEYFKQRVESSTSYTQTVPHSSNPFAEPTQYTDSPADPSTNPFIDETTTSLTPVDAGTQTTIVNPGPAVSIRREPFLTPAPDTPQISNVPAESTHTSPPPWDIENPEPRRSDSATPISPPSAPTADSPGVPPSPIHQPATPPGRSSLRIDIPQDTPPVTPRSPSPLSPQYSPFATPPGSPRTSETPEMHTPRSRRDSRDYTDYGTEDADTTTANAYRKKVAAQILSAAGSNASTIDGLMDKQRRGALHLADTLLEQVGLFPKGAAKELKGGESVTTDIASAFQENLQRLQSDENFQDSLNDALGAQAKRLRGQAGLGTSTMSRQFDWQNGKQQAKGLERSQRLSKASQDELDANLNKALETFDPERSWWSKAKSGVAHVGYKLWDAIPESTLQGQLTTLLILSIFMPQFIPLFIGVGMALAVGKVIEYKPLQQYFFKPLGAIVLTPLAVVQDTFRVVGAIIALATGNKEVSAELMGSSTMWKVWKPVLVKPKEKEQWSPPEFDAQKAFGIETIKEKANDRDKDKGKAKAPEQPRLEERRSVRSPDNLIPSQTPTPLLQTPTTQRRERPPVGRPRSASAPNTNTVGVGPRW
ncbi:hypothetical protein EDM53_00590 [Rickettsiales endosymbiont of Peranema trichophorum]|uniref:hypothetical protein n=1 Tax=Rickettsiales endosymbiont of Peranema trichophorum TaxID=2486577 RepID=UPI0010231EAA|nr:hypothetical protein [Rickettsiales endosymbiont of Peranema trichophorum]RZI47697.1 hypothetical protein EDM53_00590 [Rickettsiales endosymbiont of Peranema trichophorum]